MLCKLTGDRKLQVYRHPLRRATHRAAELGRRMSEQMMKMTMRDACGPGGTAGLPVRRVSSAGRPQLPSRDALAGLSLLLRDELPPLPGSPAVHRMQMSACSTTDQSGAVGWCSNHRARTAGGCRMQLDGYDVGRMHSWWQGHRVGCGGAGDSAGRRPEPGEGPLAE